MPTFNSSDLFFLQRPTDTADPYKAVTRTSMKALGIVTDPTQPQDPDDGQLWFPRDEKSLYIYVSAFNGWSLLPSLEDLNDKVNKIGDIMTGDLVMAGDANINFPVIGGLTIGDDGIKSGHMILLSFDGNTDPQGVLTCPQQKGGLDTIAKWNKDGLYVLKDPIHPAHVTHKEYVDFENHVQDLIIQQNSTDIIALFDDLESVRPSVMRAKYDYTVPSSYGDLTPEGRIYFSDGANIITTYTDSITEIHFNKKSNNGISYDFSTVTADFFVEIQDVKGIGIFLAEIETIVEVNQQIKINLNVIKHRDSGTLQGDPDPTEVRLLIFRNNIAIDIDAEDRFAKLAEPNTFTKSNYFEGPGVYIDSLAPLPGTVGYTKTNIFSVVNGATGIVPGKDRFNINSGGEVTAGTIPEPFMAQYDNDVVTKKYVDERMARVGAYFGDSPPSNPVPGMLWYDTKDNDLTMYMFYENPDKTTVWVPVYSPVKSGGGGGSPFIPVTGRSGYAYSSQDELNQFILNNSLYQNENGSYVIDQGESLDQAVNSLEIKGRVGPRDSLSYGSLLSAIRREEPSPVSDYVAYNGSIDRPNAIVTKDYVDTTDNLLNFKINNFQEELEAISPVIVRGQWKVDHIGSAGRVPAPGFFAIYKIASNYEFITDFIDTHEIWITEKDAVNVLHDFTQEIIIDKYIYIYDADDKNYVLGIVTSLEEDIFRGVKYYKLIVKPIQSKGDLHDDDTCFIKFFEPPSGGDGSQYVVKSDFQQLVDMMKESVENSTDFDTLKSNLIQTLDNFSHDN